jgi:tetratricopeptide (TPR) repeat protein
MALALQALAQADRQASVGTIDDALLTRARMKVGAPAALRACCDYDCATILVAVTAIDDLYGGAESQFGIPVQDFQGRRLLWSGVSSRALERTAITYLDEAIAEYPSFGEALLLRGRLRSHIGELEQAVSDFRAAAAARQMLPLGPHDVAFTARAHYECGVALERLGHEREAEAEHKRATEIDGNLSKAWQALARHYRRRKSYFDAAGCLERSLRKDDFRPPPPPLPRILRDSTQGP